MNNDTRLDDELEAVIEEARTGFDVKERLHKRGFRTGSITIYTDDETAAELGDARDEKQYNLMGAVYGTERVREGAIGELDALLSIKVEDQDPKAIKAAEKRVEELKKKLKSTAYTFELKAVPDLIVKDCRRQAKSLLKIKGKVDEQTEDVREAYNESYVSFLLKYVVTGLTDHAINESKPKITYGEAKEFKRYLHPTEWARLDAKIVEVQFKNAVGESVVSDPDF